MDGGTSGIDQRDRDRRRPAGGWKRFALGFLTLVFVLAVTALLVWKWPASPSSFLCKWQPSELTLPAAELYSGSPLLIEVDPHHAGGFAAVPPFGRVTIPYEPDRRLLGEGTLLVTDRAMKLEFDRTQISEIGDAIRIVIWLDRFDLSSTIELSTWEQRDGLIQARYRTHWSRRGNCLRRIF